MSLKIYTSTNEALDLENGFTIEIEDRSPIYNERGSQSNSVLLPASKKNNEYIGHASRLDLKYKPCVDKNVTLSDDVYRRTGKINISKSSAGYSCNIGFDESDLYQQWDGVSLRSLSWPKYKPDDGINGVISHLNDVLNDRIPADYHIFQAMLSCPEKDNNGTLVEYPEYVNKYSGSGSNLELVSDERTEIFLIENEAVNVNLPIGYGVVPFLKVSYIIAKIFSDYGYKVITSPFSDPQLSRMVVMNNSADAIVKGFIDYVDLIPECTIIELLQALYCRFGMIWFVDGASKTVRFKLLKDIIEASPLDDFTSQKASLPAVNYEKPRQLRLSSATNISGPSHYSAAPSADTLDLFLKPYKYILATHGEGYLTYDKKLGHYTVWGVYKDKPILASTDFFAWDRSADMGYEDISSVDESLPQKMEYLSMLGSLYIPCYIVGKEHRYTTIESSTVELSEKMSSSTPLCFCFSYPRQNSRVPFGSPRCYNSDGSNVTIGNHTCDISLTYTGDDGLFCRFWRGWDAILRHATRLIEVDLNLSVAQKMSIDLSAPVVMSGQRLLIDSLRYTVPGYLPVSSKLRALKLLEPYDLSDQLVPIVEQAYIWRFTDNKTTVVNAAIASQVAAWKKHVGGHPNEWKGTFMRNEVSDDTNVKLPFTVPTEDEYEAGTEYYIKKVTYSFDLYYRYNYWTVNNVGSPVYQTFEGGGVRFSIEYDLRVKAVAK